MAHTCNAIVVHCIDFRFQKFLRSWTDENLNGKKFDVISFAGSTKDLETILNQIDISVRLHKINQAVLIHHEDCGAYADESTLSNHTRDLKKAKKAILAKHPHLTVHLFYLTLNGEFKKIG